MRGRHATSCHVASRRAVSRRVSSRLVTLYLLACFLPSFLPSLPFLPSFLPCLLSWAACLPACLPVCLYACPLARARLLACVNRHSQVNKQRAGPRGFEVVPVPLSTCLALLHSLTDDSLRHNPFPWLRRPEFRTSNAQLMWELAHAVEHIRQSSTSPGGSVL